MKKILSEKKYDQVLSIDGGDIIFQTDISDLFEKNKNTFRACYEDLKTPFEVYIKKCFSKKTGEDIHAGL